MDLLERAKAKAMLKAVKPMLKMAGLPDDFMDNIVKIHMVGFDLDADEELLSVYATIRFADKDSLEAFRKIAEPMLQKIEELGKAD